MKPVFTSKVMDIESRHYK